jgi:hypothetical protein
MTEYLYQVDVRHRNRRGSTRELFTVEIDSRRANSIFFMNTTPGKRTTKAQLPLASQDGYEYEGRRVFGYILCLLNLTKVPRLVCQMR